MKIDIIIDKLTNCLNERISGKVVNTNYKKRNSKVSRTETKNWKFDWTIADKDDYDVYELFVDGSDIVQGRIALKIDGGVADVKLVESAPHNFGNKGKYEGVGGHLFAIACKISLEAGCDGVVAFTSKTGLINYYQEKIGAEVFQGQRMIIWEVNANKLMEQCFGK